MLWRLPGRDLTRDKFIAALESLSEYQGPFGYTLSFGPGHHKGVAVSHLVRAEGGRWVLQDQVVSYEGRGDEPALATGIESTDASEQESETTEPATIE